MSAADTPTTLAEALAAIALLTSENAALRAALRAARVARSTFVLTDLPPEVLVRIAALLTDPIDVLALGQAGSSAVRAATRAPGAFPRVVLGRMSLDGLLMFGGARESLARRSWMRGQRQLKDANFLQHLTGCGAAAGVRVLSLGSWSPSSIGAPDMPPDTRENMARAELVATLVSRAVALETLELQSCYLSDNGAALVLAAATATPVRDLKLHSVANLAECARLPFLTVLRLHLYIPEDDDLYLADVERLVEQLPALQELDLNLELLQFNLSDQEKACRQQDAEDAEDAADADAEATEDDWYPLELRSATLSKLTLLSNNVRLSALACPQLASLVIASNVRDTRQPSCHKRRHAALVDATVCVMLGCPLVRWRNMPAYTMQPGQDEAWRDARARWDGDARFTELVDNDAAIRFACAFRPYNSLVCRDGHVVSVPAYT